MFERFTKSARVAVVMAQETARELRSERTDVEHVLLGVLWAADPPLRQLLGDAGLTYDGVLARVADTRRAQPLGADDAEALRAIGIDLDQVRESLDAAFGANALDRAVPPEPRGVFGRWRSGHIPFTPAAKKILELSLREALAHKDDRIGAEHVLLGIVRAPNATSKAAIEAHVSLADLRTQLVELLNRAA